MQNAPIAYSHELRINVIWRNPQGERCCVRAVRNVTLLSCLARYASVVLPCYSPVDLGAMDAVGGKLRAKCMCDLTAAELLAECVGPARAS